MFVQVIRGKAKPGRFEKLLELSRRWEREQARVAPGYRGEYILREKGDPDRFVVVALFENEELARQNSNRPETNEYYREYVYNVEGELEIVDTEEAYSYRV